MHSFIELSLTLKNVFNRKFRSLKFKPLETFINMCLLENLIHNHFQMILVPRKNIRHNFVELSYYGYFAWPPNLSHQYSFVLCDKELS